MNLTEFIHRKQYEVTSADTDMFGRLRAGALMNFLVQSAIASADSLGFGFKDIRRSNLIWVLSRITIEVYHTAKWYDSLTVETWPKDHEGLLYFRDFIVKNRKDIVVAKATSGWLAIDAKTKRPHPMEYFRSALFEELQNLKALDYRPAKLPGCDGDRVSKHPVSYFDLDLNRHMTTTRYFDLVMDTFDLDFHEKHYPRKMEFNFMRESKPLAVLELYKKETAPGHFCIAGRHTGSDKDSFRALMIFQ